MKLVILGGSAPSTPALFRYFRSQTSMPPLEAVLVGRSGTRTKQIERAAKLLSAGTPVSVSSASFDDPDFTTALQGAKIVVIQVRCGGLLARDFDESFPLQYGQCGDEGLGPGGLAAAWRTWPRIQSWLEMIRNCCPKAFVIVLTSPLSILVGLAIQQFPSLQLVGTCELPWTTLCGIANSLKVSPHDVDFDYAGVNHLGWFYRLEYQGRDLIAEFAVHQSRQGGFPSGELIRSNAAVPLRYLRMHFDSSEVLHEQRTRTMPRAQELQAIGERSFFAYENGAIEEILTALTQRSAGWYSDAVGPLILAHLGIPQSLPFFLSLQNGRSYPQFGEDEVLEIPHRVEEGRLISQPPRSQVPTNLRQLLHSFLEYERLAGKAVIERNRSLLEGAIRIHPWTTNENVVPALVDTIVNRSPAYV
jgi:6-phospho-beta-glucosidase